MSQYDPTVWRDDESGGVPITAARLNKIEMGIEVAQAARASLVAIEDFFAANRVAGTTDDTTALASAVSAAAGGVLALGGNTLRITRTVEINSPVTVDARAATIACIDDQSAIGVGIFAHDFTGFRWLGGHLTQDAASRSGLYGVLRIERVSNVEIDSPNISGGSSCGIFVAGGQFIQIKSPFVSGTKADGIHISRGSADVQISNPIISNTGDDGIGIVAITAEPTDSSRAYPIIKRVLITDPIVSGLTAVGGGVSFVGAQDCSLRGGVIDGVPTSGVKVTNDNGAGVPQNALNISISGTNVRNAQNGFNIGQSTDTQLSDVQASGCSDSGVNVAAATRLLVSGGKFRGNAGFGFYEASGTGNNVIGADLRGNTAGAFQAASAAQISCITA